MGASGRMPWENRLGYGSSRRGGAWTTASALTSTCGNGTYLSARQALGCTAGLALMVLYVLALGFGNVAGLGAPEHEAFCIAFGTIVALGLNVLAYLPRRLQAPLRSTGVAVGASVAAAVGALMLFAVSPLGMWAPSVLTAAVGVVTGLGSAVALLHWGYLFSRLYIPDTASCAIAGSACVALCYAALVNTVPSPGGLVVAALLPLINAVVAVGISKSWPAGIDAVDPDTTALYKTFHDRRQQWPLFTYKVALPLVCIGAVLCLLLNHTQHNLIGNGGVVGALGLFVVAVACYVAVTFGIAGLRRRTQSYARLLSMIVPLVALAALPATALPASDTAPANTSTLAAAIVIVALTWTFMESMVLEYSLSSISIFGQGLGCIALGFVAATPLLALVPENSPWFDIAGNLVCLLMVLGMLPAHPAADLSRSAYGRGAEREAAERGTGRGTAQVSAVAGTTSGEGKGARMENEPGGADATGGRAATGDPGTRPVPTAPVEVANPVRHAPDAQRGKGRFIRRCEYVAGLYQLSPRELEVLILLAKGRSMNHIKDELVVSEGTAKTHIRHVYKKLDVHSRHELVAIIEAVDVE